MWRQGVPAREDWPSSREERGSTAFCPPREPRPEHAGSKRQTQCHRRAATARPAPSFLPQRRARGSSGWRDSVAWTGRMAADVQNRRRSLLTSTPLGPAHGCAPVSAPPDLGWASASLDRGFGEEERDSIPADGRPSWPDSGAQRSVKARSRRIREGILQVSSAFDFAESRWRSPEEEGAPSACPRPAGPQTTSALPWVCRLVCGFQTCQPPRSRGPVPAVVQA
ncbi:uncharacterized protein LOC131838020 [Mustela lutreola]|uniref:uncharacterized protein LOC131838020 n=1 Tax=Mustela lutreola TaxID=9666 RepID=UPI00279725FE|nr:uncharacterized protein LOC131838020 [Mustela lutreola]